MNYYFIVYNYFTYSVFIKPNNITKTIIINGKEINKKIIDYQRTQQNILYKTILIFIYCISYKNHKFIDTIYCIVHDIYTTDKLL